MSEQKICPTCQIRPACSDHYLAIYCFKCTRDKRRLHSKVYACNWRAKRFGVEGTFTIDEWKALCDQYGKRCLNCKRPGDYHSLTPDHIVSMSIGGTNHISNIQPVCESCNLSKNNQTIDYRPGYNPERKPFPHNAKPLE